MIISVSYLGHHLLTPPAYMVMSYGTYKCPLVISIEIDYIKTKSSIADVLVASKGYIADYWKNKLRDPNKLFVCQSADVP